MAQRRPVLIAFNIGRLVYKCFCDMAYECHSATVLSNYFTVVKIDPEKLQIRVL